MAKEENRCWPGYEPVKGKEPHSQGSCRPKSDGKLSESEKKFRGKRREQLDQWEAEHPHTRKSASQHLHAPGATAKKKAAPKKQTAATKRTKTRKSAAKKTS